MNPLCIQRKVAALIVVCFCFGALAAQKRIVRPHPSSNLYFTKNMGQWKEPFLYKADIPDGAMFLENDRITYNFMDEESAAIIHNLIHRHFSSDTVIASNVHLHAFRMSFKNSPGAANILEEEKLETYHNYYLGSDRTQWKSRVPLFNKIVYQDVYDGIDYEIFSSLNTFKYNFVLQPKADLKKIVMLYEGCELKLSSGKLIIKTSVNEMAEAAPYAYQVIDNRPVQVPCIFVLNGNEVSFQLGEYDHDQPLVIDPVIVFATYSGSSVDNFGFSAAFDSKERLYSAGIATRRISGSYPATTGAYMTSFQGGSNRIIFPGVDIATGWDVSISKYDSAGQNLLFATYLGGKENEYPHSLLVDKSDNLVVLGSTFSNNFPHSVNAYDTVLNSNGDTAYTDMFITKFDATGKFLASTLIGGDDFDGNNMSANLQYNYADEFRGDIIADNNNSYYVGSVTTSGNFPVKNAFQGSKKAGRDGIVFKIDSNLSKLSWSTYFGGDSDDAIYSIDLDKLNEIYVSGGTKSLDFPVATTTYQKNLAGDVDGFISKLSNDGQVLLGGTYIGTSGYDQVFFVEIDKAGNIFATGQTEGTFPVSSGVYKKTNGSQFIVKLSENLQTLLLSTVFGSGRLIGGHPDPDISPTAFLVDNCDLIYVCGWGSDLNMGHAGSTQDMLVSSTSPPAYSTTDNNDFYIIVFDKDMIGVRYNTYFGENGDQDHVDGGTNRFDKRGVIYASVCSSCGKGPAGLFPTQPPNVKFPNNLSPRCSNAAFKIDFQLQTSIIADFRASPRIGCAPQEFLMNSNSSAVRYFWDFGDGTTDTVRDPKHTYNAPGTYKIRLVCEDTNTCNRFDTAYDEVTLYDKSIADFEYTVSFCDNSVTLKNKSTNQFKYLWDFGDGALDSTTDEPKHIYAQSGKYNVTLYVNRGFPCADSMVKVIDFDKYKPIDPLIPNVFSPNGDGKNDLFEIGGLNAKCDKMEMTVYTRWGQVVFESKQIGIWWDGNYKVKPLGDGVYYYTIKITDYQGTVTDHKGDVTIIR
jgi:gliding motility-associated-like protein